MVKLLVSLILISSFVNAQTTIGKIEGVSITLEDGHYEVIFQSEADANDYVSFYMSQAEGTDDGLEALKRSVFRLFVEKSGDYLLQFEFDSVLLAYDDNKVQMVLWRQHDGDNRFASSWFSKMDFIALFGGLMPVKKM